MRMRSQFAICLDVVRQETGVAVADIVSKRQTAEVSRARQLAMWVGRHATPYSLPQIGRLLGKRDHTTVVHGLKRIAQQRSRLPEFALMTQQLVDRARALILDDKAANGEVLSAMGLLPANPGHGLTQREILELVIEEAAEVIQAATKCLRFGFDREYQGYGRNDLVLAAEVGDFLGALDGLRLDADTIEVKRRGKLAKARMVKQMIAATGVSA